MRGPSRRFILRIALATAAALAAGTAVGVAAIPDTAGTIHACFDPNGTPAGVVRVIDSPTQTCAANETALDWNQRGEPGPPGPAGPQGPAGVSGLSGDPGTTTPSTTTNDTFSTPTQAGGPSADMFLKLDGIPGESNDTDHKREIDVTSVALALGRGGDGTGSAGAAPATTSRSTGTAVRRAGLRTLRIDKLYDAASPRLLQAAASGQRIKSAVLTFRRSTDDDVE